MKAWKRGRPLTGTNQEKQLNIKFEDYKHKVLLSIVKGTHATAEANVQYEELSKIKRKGINYTCAATIPEDVLYYLVSKGGSLKDLLNFIDILRILNVSLPTKDALNLLNAH